MPRLSVRRGLSCQKIVFVLYLYAGTEQHCSDFKLEEFPLSYTMLDSSVSSGRHRQVNSGSDASATLADEAGAKRKEN
jgi:hypothetical protein